MTHQPFHSNGASPWQVIQRSVVYRNQWSEVWEDQLQDDQGRSGLYGYFAPKSWAIIAALTVDQQVWMVRQWRHAYNCYSWELPCGSLEPDERPLQAAQRELAEETGHSAKTWTALPPVHNSDARVAGQGHPFIATDLQPSHSSGRDDTEFDLIAQPVSVHDALAACRAGTITNVATIATLLQVETQL